MLQKLLFQSLLGSNTLGARQFACTSRFYQKNEPELDEDGLPKDYKLTTLKLLSKRIDIIVHRMTSLSKMDTEKAIAKGNVKINEEVTKKKAHPVEAGDEIDVWLSKYADNDDLAIAHRMEVRKLTMDEKEGFVYVIKYWKNAVIENWKNKI